MNEKQLAAETIAKEVNRLKGLALAGDMLQKVGDLEQTEKELRSTIELEERKLAGIRAKHEAILTESAEATKKSLALREEWAGEEKRLAELAVHEMGRVRAAASEEGEKMMAQALVKLKEITAKTAAQESRLVEVNKEIAVREFKLASLGKEMAELTKKHLG